MPFKTLELPKLRGELFQDKLFNFYCDLGWDPENEIADITKVRVNKQEFEDILEEISANPDLEPEEKKAIAMLFLAYGPTADEDVPRGKVAVENDWLRPDED